MWSSIKSINVLFFSYYLILQCNGQKDAANGPPRLQLISPKVEYQETINKESVFIDIKAKSTLGMRCEGSKELAWTFPENTLVNKLV